MNEINRSANFIPPSKGGLVIPFRAATGSVKAAHAYADNAVPVTSSATDEVDFSDAAIALSEGKPAPSNSDFDGIRVTKVARIRSDIQAGTYDVDGKIDTVVDHLLDELAG